MRAAQQTAQNQTQARQAFIACALERYHLAQGDYPESLDVLVPKFADKIPVSMMRGEPFKYQREADGTYALLFVPWNVQLGPNANAGTWHARRW